MNEFLSTTTLVAVLALSTAMAPTAAAGTSTHSDEITPSAFTPSLSTAHIFNLDLSAAESVDISLSWDSKTTDLDILFIPPGGTCNLITDFPDCHFRVADSATCADTADQGQTVGVGPATETVTTTADDHDQGEAVYDLRVAASAAVPGLPVEYDLTVTTSDDGHEGIDDGRERGTTPRSQGHCRTP